YHAHEKKLSGAIRKASSEARITKRVTAHIFRHSYASHLLEANFDIRTIQELLGHSDVKTTMIYTHTVNMKTIREPKSPLDF
ncbi:MAG: site-specific recombinase XerD, partial [Candidatus Pelagisphaera sp.]